MADEIAYVISGRGESLQCEVEAEIAERYYGRIAKEPTRWEFSSDDTVYVPQNHVHQYVNTGDEPLRLLIVQNRLIKYLGYDNVAYFEDAPEYSGAEAAVSAAT
jgi:oxalate decarboxylase/phosphoglucose isomerase-like protein (cupin superfamily)